MASALDTDPCVARLTNLTTININQTSSGGYNGCNYAVLSGDEVLFNLVEDNPARSIFTAGGSRRAFRMDGVDNTGRKMFSIRRPAMFSSDKMEIYLNNGKAIVIRMERTFMTPIFSINDARDCQTLRVKKGKMSQPYKLQTPTKIDIGSIEKKWLGWGRELMSYNDNYVIIFPADLAILYKVAVIVTCIFIDFRFHEGK